MLKVGSLFTGYGGLDMAAEAHYDARTVWTSDIDPGACKIIAHRMPGIPNLGDITKIDWTQVEPVDIITGGSPCQDLSHAGKRAGMGTGTRSNLWVQMREAIAILRPRYVVWENVRGALSSKADSAVEPCPRCVGDGKGQPALRALGRVLGDLAELGYDASWHGLRAADVGAPHGRFRVFVLARRAGHGSRGAEYWQQPGTPAGGPREPGQGVAGDADRGGSHGWPSARQQRETGPSAGPLADAERGGRDGWAGTLGQAWRTQPQNGRNAPADANDAGPQGRESVGRRDVPAGSTLADPSRDGRHEGRSEPAREFRGPDAAIRGYAPSPDADGHGFQGVRRLDPEQRDVDGCSGADSAWGKYEPAIRRWERVLGRPAPAPTETGPKGGQRLSPRFEEWMMGLPLGWVTDVPGLSRNAQMKAVGNGVVPQQAFAALAVLDGISAAA